MACGGADKSVLIFGGEPEDRARLCAAFAPDYTVREAQSIADALSLPGKNTLLAALVFGADPGEKLRGSAAFSQIPVLLMDPSADPGAADAMPPQPAAAVRARAERLARLLRSARRGEETRWRQALARVSRIDPNTGLCNTATFCVAVSRRLREEPAARWVIARWDIDRFKSFNDAYGTARGDLLLSEIGRGFVQSAPAAETLGMRVYGHWDADHFVSLWRGDDIDPERLYRYTADEMSRAYPDYRFVIHFGLYRITDPTVDVGVMCDRALLALKAVKGNYERHFAWYDESMRAELIDAQEIIGDMQEALEKGQFVAYFQPQYDYEDGRLIGAEALARWQHPTRGLVSPARFIPVFEKNGFIFELDRCIWRSVCRSLRDWLDRGLDAPSVSVNISRRDLYRPCLVDTFQSLISEYRLEPSLLRLEITESAYMEAAEQLISVVKRFRALGFTVEMDDFGSGYSSLNTLKDVPVDTLKLDMRFVSASENGGRGGSILSSVVRMAHALEIPVIAEGVETKQQADFLKSVGWLFMQGYLFAKPMPPDAFERLIREHPLPLAAQRRFRRGVDGAADFLDATTQSTLLFNSFVGGAGIVEYAGGRVAALRLNDRFFDVLGVSRRQFGNRQYRLLEQISPDTRAAYVRMLEDAVRTGEEAGCECLFSPLGDAGEPVWLYNRVRFLSAKVDGCLFYLSVENITERKKLIDDNSELTNRLSGIINSVPGGVQRFLVTPERFQLTYCNDTTPAMLGFTNEEFRALFAEERLGTVLPNDRVGLRRMLDGMLAEDAPRTGEIRLRHIAKDGSWRWLRMTGSVLQREPGRVSLSTIAMDISDTVAAEEKFLAQQKELSAIVSSVPGGIFKYAAEADDQFTYVSETMLELLGYTREEFTQKFHNRFSEMVYREDRAHALQKITSDIARTGSLDSCEYRIETKSGALKWVYDVGHLIADENGRRWFIVVIVDIDERKRLEKSVSELDARAARTGLYGRLLDEVWNALIVCDRGTRELLFANAAALRLADLTREQARAMDGFDFLYRGDVPAEVSAMANAALPAACEYEREGCYYFAHLSAIDWNGRDAAL